MSGHRSPLDPVESGRSLAVPPDQYGRVTVVGLGQVGASMVAVFAAAGHEVVGYDADPERAATLDREGLPAAVIEAVSGGRSRRPGEGAGDPSDPRFTADPEPIRDSEYVLIAVPTPVTETGQPDLSCVASAGETVGSRLTPGTTIVLTSTVYPGGTETVLVPALEEASELTAGEAFAVGYSPERLDPGDPDRGTGDVTRVVSARDPAVAADLAALFATAVDAEVHRAPSIRVAEAAKCIENVHRDLVIAFANECAQALDAMGIDCGAVFEAARTKWNFPDVRPGLVDGQCIPVDPYQFAHAARRHGVEPELLLAGRRVNESMPAYAVELTLDALRARDAGTVAGARLLVLGLAYKPGVGEVATTPLRSVVAGLRARGVRLAGHDPHVDPGAARETLGIEIRSERSAGGFDGVLFATGHPEFDDLDVRALRSELTDQPVIVDLAGVLDRDDLAGTDAVYRGL